MPAVLSSIHACGRFFIKHLCLVVNWWGVGWAGKKVTDPVREHPLPVWPELATQPSLQAASLCLTHQGGQLPDANANSWFHCGGDGWQGDWSWHCFFVSPPMPEGTPEPLCCAAQAPVHWHAESIGSSEQPPSCGLPQLWASLPCPAPRCGVRQQKQEKGGKAQRLQWQLSNWSLMEGAVPSRGVRGAQFNPLGARCSHQLDSPDWTEQSERIT